MADANNDNSQIQMDSTGQYGSDQFNATSNTQANNARVPEAPL